MFLRYFSHTQAKSTKLITKLNFKKSLLEVFDSHRSMMFEDREQMRMFGSKTEEVIGNQKIAQEGANRLHTISV